MPNYSLYYPKEMADSFTDHQQYQHSIMQSMIQDQKRLIYEMPLSAEECQRIRRMRMFSALFAGIGAIMGYHSFSGLSELTAPGASPAMMPMTVVSRGRKIWNVMAAVGFAMVGASVGLACGYSLGYRNCRWAKPVDNDSSNNSGSTNGSSTNSNNSGNSNGNGSLMVKDGNLAKQLAILEAMEEGNRTSLASYSSSAADSFFEEKVRYAQRK